MNHASLFSGIGGFDLAAREVGWNNVFQCEIDPFCQSVLLNIDIYSCLPVLLLICFILFMISS